MSPHEAGNPDASVARDASPGEATDADLTEPDANGVGSDAAADAAEPQDDAGPDAGGPANPFDAVVPATASRLAERSAPNYESNQSGVIATDRLLDWLNDWANARPSEIPGDLVIAQLGTASEPGKFIRGGSSVRNEGGVEVTRRVRVYDGSDLRALLETRSNGIVAVGTVPANGLRIDSWLRKYNVRPNHDYVLLTAGEGSAQAVGDLARAWLTLRYWGVEHGFLGLHNGSVEAAVPPTSRQALPDEPLYDGEVRVFDMVNDHFVVLADVGAVRDALGRNTLVDVRPEGEYAGAVLGESPSDNTCILGAPQCSPAFSGRIAGAVHLSWQSLFDPVHYTLRPLDQIDLALAAAGIDDSKTVIVYDGDQGFSAAVTFVLSAVAGVPARWYAASFLEWGTLNATHPTPDLRLLPESSVWRSDVFPTLTEASTTWASSDACARPLLLDAAPTAADRVQKIDLEYKRNPPVLPPVGGGVNGCL